MASYRVSLLFAGYREVVQHFGAASSDARCWRFAVRAAVKLARGN